LSAFRAERALPSAVFGPRDFAPFFRLAAARAWLIGTAARGAAPVLDMAVILWWRGKDGAGWRVMAEAPGRAAMANRQCSRF
jgi:hypothetical protein